MDKDRWLSRNCNYRAEEKGLWIVRGEDPNPDMGGSHIMPILGYFEGKYGEVLDIAFNLSNFWQWGRGGSVEKVKVIDVKDFAKRQRIIDLKKDLEKQLEAINKELEEF